MLLEYIISEIRKKCTDRILEDGSWILKGTGLLNHSWLEWEEPCEPEHKI